MLFSRRKNKILKAAAVLLCACTALYSLSGCFPGKTASKTDKVSRINTIAPKVNTASVHYCDPLNPGSVLAAKSGLLDLYFDKESFSFFVHDKSAEQFWRALPLIEPGADAEEAAVVTVTALWGSDYYILNSQDNSVAFNTAEYEKTKTGLKISYSLFPDEATAKKASPDENDLAVKVTVDASLVDGALNIDCTAENINPQSSAIITEIKPLNYFGAFTTSERGDFMLVPDGCGAIIRTDIYDDSFEPLKFTVYGNDPAVGPETDNGSAVVPAFGIKHGSSAFAALITDGDASAFISADKSTATGEYNTVSAGFTVTPVCYDNGRLSTAESNDKPHLSICYRFLSGGNATYSGIASACREQLIRNAVLSNRSAEKSDYLPLNLIAVGAARNQIIGNFGFNIIGTSFEQALDMLTRMKNKGINSINLRYLGALNAGTAQKDAKNSLNTAARLGSVDELAQLYDYCFAQNMKLFLNIDILSARSLSPSAGALGIQNKRLYFSRSNSVYPFAGKESYTARLRRPADLDGLALSVLTDVRSLPFSGFCIDDAAEMLYSDYSNGVYTTREKTKAAVIDTVTPLTVGRSTMTAGGNFYLLKNADVAVNIPAKSSVAESGAYCSIPFVQLILHGSLDYSGAPLNLGSGSDEELLRCIEYGACPCYEWSYNALSADEETPFDWNTGINAAAEYYSKANTALGDLRGARMTDHSRLADGVFVTVYDTGARIFVNYTDKDFTASGTVVPAKGFERVN